MPISASIIPGQVFRDERFYFSRETGDFEPKYLLILGRTPGEDLIARLLTSRAHGRPESPPCYHGNPYPAFYLGIVGGVLSVKSWLDLRGLNDIDPVAFGNKQKRGQISLITSIDRTLLLPSTECAAAAEDTTRLQEASIRNTLAALRR